MVKKTKKGRNSVRDRQERFIQEYLIEHKPRQAYIKAGYSKKCARQNAHRLLTTNEYVINRIAEETAKLSIKMGITRETIATEAEEHRQLALGRKDIGAANAALVIKAKCYGLQTDRLKTEEVERERELTEAEQAEARRIAQIRLADTG